MSCKLLKALLFKLGFELSRMVTKTHLLFFGFVVPQTGHVLIRSSLLYPHLGQFQLLLHRIDEQPPLCMVS